MNTGIYTITAPSGEQYVGSAVDIERRWTRHRKDLRTGKHGNRVLARAAGKYGLDRLVFSKVVICAPHDLLFYEQRFIDGLKPKYNLAPRAGSSLGVRRSAQFKEKISNAMRGRVMSIETRQKIGRKHRGKVLAAHQLAALALGRSKNPVSIEKRREQAKAMHTPAAKAKKAAAMVGHKVSPETRAKISVALKGKLHSAESYARQSVSLKRTLSRQKTSESGNVP